MRTAHARAAGVAAALLLCQTHALALDASLDIAQYAHTAWKAREGLRGSVRSMVQTPDGYLWLGTEFGLTRFDGVKFVPWTPPGQPLPSTNIRSLFASRDGTLWIGTVEGLASWKQGTLTRYPELAGRNVLAIVQDRAGTVWAGTFGAPNGSLCAIQNAGVKCYGEEGIFRQWVEALFEDGGGNLWVHTGNGVWLWQPGQHRHFPARLPGSFEASHTIVQNENGTGLLVISDGKLIEIVDGKVSEYHVPGVLDPFPALNLLRDRDGALWIGTEGGGLLRVHGRRTSVFSQSDGLSGDRILSLFEDREGNIWVGTADGLDCFREFTVPSISVKQGLSSPTVETVLVARDKSVWMSTMDGLNRWNDGRLTIYRTESHPATAKRFGVSQAIAPRLHSSVEARVTEITDPGLPDSAEVGSLFEDDRGRIWVSTPGGIARFKDNKFTGVKEAPGGFVNVIAGDGKAGIWIAYEDRGLLHLADSKVIERIPWSSLGPGVNASAVVPDATGGLWLGFFQGGLVYFKDGQVRESFGKNNGLGGGRVMGLQLDRDGTLWAATEGGLSRLRNGRIATLNGAAGLPCDTVHWAIEDDDSDLWLYSACGLIRVAKQNFEAWASDPVHNKIQFAVFDESDGVRSHALLTGYAPRLSKSPDGKLWFADFEGVSIVDPRHLRVNTVPPPVHVEQIVADRKVIWQNWSGIADSSLNLAKLTRDVEIDYTALSLVAPEKNRFKYRLEGYERDWHEVGNRRQAFYNNLAPKRYRFRVMAANNSGVWNESGDTLEFSVAPAFYQTKWFYALGAAAIVALLWAAYQLRVRLLRRNVKQLRDVIDTIPAYVWSAQPDGAVDFINHRWLEFSGLTLEQALGWGWEDTVHPEDRARLVERWRSAIASGEPLETEARMRGADGQYRWLLFRAVPQRDPSGKIVKWYGKSTDIEDRKRAEQERERVRQLESDLEHTNRVGMMGELSASIAHEVNQPLAGIVSNGGACLRLLSREVPDIQEALEAVRDIVRDGKRAGEVIARIRALTKKTSAPRELLDLNAVIGEVLAIIKDEAKRSSVVIRTRFADGISLVSGDRVQLQQVLLNLIMNAIQAMSGIEDRPRELTITSLGLDPDQVQVTVQDSGIGIDPENMARIFDSFYTTKSSGMGMGLSICRSIVHHHGGKLWVTPNVDGPGTSFHFALPIFQEQDADAVNRLNHVSS